MQDMIGPKYFLDGDLFSIQHLYRKGDIIMPQPHAHSLYEIFYLIQGERVYFIDGRVYTAQRGDMVVINPNDLHSTASSDVLEYERILINFSPEFLGEDGNPVDIPLLPFEQGFHLLRISKSEQAVVEKLLWEMIRECGEKETGFTSYVRALLHQLLTHMFRCIQQNALQQPGYSHPMHEKISEIASYLKKHFELNLTLEQTARQFYISPTYLSRVFTKLTGFHFREYLQVIRIREAQKRLKNTKEKIQKIAEQVGFGHIAHFNKTFKNITGMSPLQYRKQSYSAEGE